MSVNNHWMDAVSSAVRRKLRQPKSFRCFYFEARGDGGLLTKGGIPLLKFVRGPEKGSWSFAGCKVSQCTLSKADVEIIDRRLARKHGAQA